MTPAAVFAMTPHQFLIALSPESGPRRLTGADRLAILADTNRKRAAAGRLPVVPPWLWPDLPRVGRPPR